MSEELSPQTPQPKPEDWFYADGQKQLGPLDRETMMEMIGSHDIGPDILVWSKGMPQWLPLQSSSLANLLPGDQPPPPIPSLSYANQAPRAPLPVEKVHPPQPLRSASWAWWNLAIPGIAQVVFGQVEKGMLIILVGGILVTVTMGLGLLIAWPISIIDAMKVHRVVSHRGWVGKWDWFPS